MAAADRYAGAGRDWIFGVMAAVGWAVSGAGAAVLPPIVRALGGKAVRAASVLRVCQGLALIPLATTTESLS